MTGRRAFLRGCAGLCAAAAIPGCGSDVSDTSTDTDATRFRVRSVDVPLGSVILVTSSGVVDSGCSDIDGVLVGRDELGLWAYSNVCTHARGLVPAPGTAGESACCLHGAVFDRNGDVLDPVSADQADLPHFVVHVDGDEVVIDTAMEEPDRARRVAAS